jgi:hypothetical protein
MGRGAHALELVGLVLAAALALRARILLAGRTVLAARLSVAMTGSQAVIRLLFFFGMSTTTTAIIGGRHGTGGHLVTTGAGSSDMTGMSFQSEPGAWTRDNPTGGLAGLTRLATSTCALTPAGLRWTRHPETPNPSHRINTEKAARMTTLASSVHIDAPAHIVWQALTDLERYPDWNPYYRSASGVVAVGETILLDATLDEGFGKPRRGPVRVVAAIPGKELRWTSRFLLPGVMDADHRFTLTESSPTRTTVTQSEEFAGLLVRLAPSVLKKVHAKFGELDLALKTRAEELSRQADLGEGHP